MADVFGEWLELSKSLRMLKDNETTKTFILKQMQTINMQQLKLIILNGFLKMIHEHAQEMQQKMQE